MSKRTYALALAAVFLVAVWASFRLWYWEPDSGAAGSAPAAGDAPEATAVASSASSPSPGIREEKGAAPGGAGSGAAVDSSPEATMVASPGGSPPPRVQEEEAVAPLVEAIKGITAGTTGAGSMQELVVKLDGDGVDVIPTLVEWYYAHGDSATRKTRAFAIIAALEKLGTPEARDTLLGLALERRRYYIQWSGQAATSYVQLCDGPEQKAKLFPGLITAKQRGLLSLTGERLTPEVVAALGKEFGAGSPYLGRDNASRSFQRSLLRVLRDDPNAATAGARIDTVLDIGAELASTIRSSSTEDSTWQELLCTAPWADEEAYLRYVRAMPDFVGGPDVLRTRLRTATGERRTMCLLALGVAGEKAVRGELVSYIAAEQNGAFRQFGVVALGGVAGPGDLPLLRRLAESDPFCRSATPSAGSTSQPPSTGRAWSRRGGSKKEQPSQPVPAPAPSGAKKQLSYPVRASAKSVLRCLEEGQNEGDGE